MADQGEVIGRFKVFATWWVTVKKGITQNKLTCSTWSHELGSAQVNQHNLGKEGYLEEVVS